MYTRRWPPAPSHTTDVLLLLEATATARLPSTLLPATNRLFIAVQLPRWPNSLRSIHNVLSVVFIVVTVQSADPFLVAVLVILRLTLKLQHSYVPSVLRFLFYDQ